MNYNHAEKREKSRRGVECGTVLWNTCGRKYSLSLIRAEARRRRRRRWLVISIFGVFIIFKLHGSNIKKKKTTHKRSGVFSSPWNNPTESNKTYIKTVLREWAKIADCYGCIIYLFFLLHNNIRKIIEGSHYCEVAFEQKEGSSPRLLIFTCIRIQYTRMYTYTHTLTRSQHNVVEMKTHTFSKYS